MLHVFIGEILANMTQVSDVAPGPLVLIFRVFIGKHSIYYNMVACLLVAARAIFQLSGGCHHYR
jgi:hypothetical protein